jgi:predicted DNA-binding antitoxin AbrB/MazE fold protein
MSSAMGHIENGVVRLDQNVDWSEGQEVLVIALPADATDRQPPPLELLEEDAREFATRPEIIASIGRRELP